MADDHCRDGFMFVSPFGVLDSCYAYACEFWGFVSVYVHFTDKLNIPCRIDLVQNTCGYEIVYLFILFNSNKCSYLQYY